MDGSDECNNDSMTQPQTLPKTIIASLGDIFNSNFEA